MDKVVVNNWEKKKSKIGLSNPLMIFATLLLCIVALNADWSGIQVLWWGVVAFFVLSWVLTCGLRFVIDINYTIWMIAFFAFCVLSLSWAISTSLVSTALKSLIVHLFILLLLRSAICGKQDINRLLNIIALSAVVNSLYLVITNFELLVSNAEDVDLGIRLGAEGNWNANLVGMMSAVSVIILLYNLQKSKNILQKSLFIVAIVSMVIVSLLSGSRKALIIVLFGMAVYLLLTARNKKIRTVLMIAFLIGVLYYLVMKVPFFYSIIGWRVEGLIAMFTGEGNVDSSAEYRRKLIEEAIDTWKQYPLVGCGLDCFRIFGMEATGRDYYAHNNYVELLADLGIIGAVIYYGGYVFVMKHFLSVRKRGDNLYQLLLTLLGIIMIIDYACVSYSDFLFKLIFLIMFAVVPLKHKETGEQYGGN